MSPQLRIAYTNEMTAYKLSSKQGDYVASWNHLERAHILGQYDSLPHLETHWHMWKLAFKTLNLKEMILQVPRLILAVPGSLTGKAPKGNPGSARVGIFTPTPIPEDLETLLRDRT